MDDVKLNLTPALEKIGALIKREAIRKCPVGDTGELRRSIDYRIEGNTVILFTTSPIAPFVEYGTPPHIIEPKDKKALAFEMGRTTRLEAGTKVGPMTIVKKVHHPGTAPHPFMRPAVYENIPEISRIIKEDVTS